MDRTNNLSRSGIDGWDAGQTKGCARAASQMEGVRAGGSPRRTLEVGWILTLQQGSRPIKTRGWIVLSEGPSMDGSIDRSA